jgi:hypothetical protein
MPLWRFKLGDFRSPVEIATGIRPKIVTAHGILEQAAPVGWLEWWRAKRQVDAIRKAAELVNNARLKWDDEGDVDYAEQSPGMEALRAYAKRMDCADQMPEFAASPEKNYYKHPVWGLGVERLSCPHLVEHDCYNISCRASLPGWPGSSRTGSSGTGQPRGQSALAYASWKSSTSCRRVWELRRLFLLAR